MRIPLILLILTIMMVGTAGANTLNVTDESTTNNYTTIQYAVDNATSGDTIHVYPGTYSENVVVNKELNIISVDGASATHVMAAASSDHVFNISANNVTIDGFNVSGADESDFGKMSAGIYLRNVTKCTIFNNILSNNRYGIYLAASNNNNLTGNNVSENSVAGIHLDSSHGNYLVNNNISDNIDRGINIDLSNYNNLTNNEITKNSLQGISLYKSTENSMVSNTISGNGYTNYGAEAGIYLGSSTDNNIYNNWFNNSVNFKVMSGCDYNNWNTTSTTGPNIIGGPHIGGNYWATPDGDGFSQVNTDSNGDGFCDTPEDTYVIHEVQNNYDYLPLAGDNKEPSVVPITPPADKRIGPGHLLELNVSVTDTSEISSVVINVSSINNTINEIPLTNVSGYWVNNITVDTIADGVYNLSINATDVYGNSNTSVDISVERDSFVTVGAEGKDDTTIQNAINNTYDGDTIQVFPGTYEENLVVDKGLTIHAASDDPSETVIKAATSSQVIRINPEYGSQSNFTITGFTIDGNDTSYEGLSLYSNLKEVSPANYNFTFTDNVITNVSSTALTVNGLNEVHILNNNITDIGYAGIIARNINGLEINNNSLTNISSRSPESYSPDSVDVASRVMSAGISVSGVYEINIKDNVIQKCGSDGIHISPINDIYVQGQETYHEYAQSISVSGNEIHGVEYNGISIEGDRIVSKDISENVDYTLIINDNVIKSRYSGIYVEDTKSIECIDITNNDINSSSSSIDTILSSINLPSGILIVGEMVGVDVSEESTPDTSIKEVSINNNSINRSFIGIFVLGTSSPQIQDNIISSSKIGIAYGFNSEIGQHPVIAKNHIYNTSYGIDIFGITNLSISDNTINEFTEVGIGCEFTQNTSLNGNIINAGTEGEKGTGIQVSQSENATIRDNSIESARYGLYFEDSANRYNSIAMATDAEISITRPPSFSTQNSTVSGNTISNNGAGGIYLEYAENNTFYNNYLNNINNTVFGEGVANNTWNTTVTAGPNIIGGPRIGGNFWATPQGDGFGQVNVDSTSNGFCDNPRGSYNISGSGQYDYLPLAATTESKKVSSSGGRVYVGPSMPAENVQNTDSGIKRVLAGSNVKYDFSENAGSVFGISFDAKDDKGNVVAKVQVLKDKPDDVDTPSGNSYQMMSITVGNQDTISENNADNILIEFKVSKEWTEQNNIDPTTIRMTRFHDGDWQDLPSNEVGEDDEYFYFTAETSGFSVFSIVGDEYKEVIEELVAEESEVEDVEEPASENQNAQTPGFTGMFAVALIAGAALVMQKKD
ncbi:NosD domain-containing protein [Methanohalophilus mahii]|uniref:Periplasmic copper-binding protein n=1 Tax=Methanohalophilus mahii (strain ATCC 35705 / DSM 5219 / SLP) TaxID=547558 RepID=D5E8Y5_METMS|nr:NosD domain-containing protein [Methanohalophilus mahii]ADE35644.1 periplasmic copper-binding protein [Methanohalophilus mahii DSM 5219]